MARSVASGRVQAEDKTLALPMLGAVPRTQAPYTSPVEPQWLLDCVGRAIDRTLPRKEAAYLMGVDAGNLTHTLQGEGHLSAKRLAGLPQVFWIALIDELRGHFGITDQTEVQRAIEDISRGLSILAARATR